MITRRMTIALMAAAACAAVSAETGQPAKKEADYAVALVERTGAQLIAIAASADMAAEKHRKLAEIIASTVDVDDIGQFCLGRFWASATPDQQTLYMTQFRELLVYKISAYLPAYARATLTTGSVGFLKDLRVVSTTIERRNHLVMAVNWVVGMTNGSPRIIDLQAEGVSLRQTQRADFLSFLLRHEESMDQLNEGMARLVVRIR